METHLGRDGLVDGVLPVHPKLLALRASRAQGTHHELRPRTCRASAAPHTQHPCLVSLCSCLAFTPQLPPRCDARAPTCALCPSLPSLCARSHSPVCALAFPPSPHLPIAAHPLSPCPHLRVRQAEVLAVLQAREELLPQLLVLLLDVIHKLLLAQRSRARRACQKVYARGTTWATRR